MPSFSELKAKAAKTASSGVEKLQGVKDRNTSVPMKKTNWDPYSGQPPPPPPPPRSLVNQKTKPAEVLLLPPPSRTASSSGTSAPPTRGASASPGPAPPLPARAISSTPPVLHQRSNSINAAPAPPSRTIAPIARNAVVASASGPPPPVARSTRPDSTTESLNSPPTYGDSKSIDWANLSQEDKEAFFNWLDEFFSKHLNIVLPPRTTTATHGHSKPNPNLGAPPPLKLSSKPSSWSQGTAPGNSNSAFVTSYPPKLERGESAAEDLAAYFIPTAQWITPWYHTASGIPPPLEGNSDIRYVNSWQSRGSIKTTRLGVLFCDLSVFWGSVTYSLANPESKIDTKRQGSYLPRPASLDRATLVAANEIYGDTIALFAESFLGTGKYCARGECWDLASEALKYFEQYDYIPKPVPSISRTHGHLIYEGKVTARGKEMMGRWRGGDDRVRRGDIVEWRRVRIASDGYPGSFTTLGDPDHTAVIISDSKPIPNAGDGFSIPPSEMGLLTVVEQSVGQPPVRVDYNLQGMEEGEMWIYRPISLEVYLGISDLTPTPPERLPRLRNV